MMRPALPLLALLALGGCAGTATSGLAGAGSTVASLDGPACGSTTPVKVNVLDTKDRKDLNFHCDFQTTKAPDGTVTTTGKVDLVSSGENGSTAALGVADKQAASIDKLTGIVGGLVQSPAVKAAVGAATGGVAP